MSFEDYSRRATDALMGAILKSLFESGAEVEAQVKRNTVVDSVHTKDSWKAVVDGVKFEAVIGSNAENAIWEEFGTGEYALKGNGRKTPWYVPVDGYTGKKKPSYNGKVVVVYGKKAKSIIRPTERNQNEPYKKQWTQEKGQ